MCTGERELVSIDNFGCIDTPMTRGSREESTVYLIAAGTFALPLPGSQ